MMHAETGEPKISELRNVTLELSAKPFFDDGDATIREVAARMFRQWANLTAAAGQISVLLWLADGSEILEYSGDLSQKFEWAYWCGTANPYPAGKAKPAPRQERNCHRFPVKYRPDAAPRTYDWMRRVVAGIKETGREMTGKDIRVGTIFDNGPEFAVSDFKFRRHAEIAQGHSAYPNSFVTCNSVLHADSRKYAAFPQGIKEGTTLGSFLGAQYSALAKDVGFDYIWLSNGMGFGVEPWKITGAVFDGEKFHPEVIPHMREELLRFWKDFIAACPAAQIELRGSNFSAGVEMASEAAPLHELYNEWKVVPPVNSPWAALNYNSGLEITAWMSHIAETPNTFPFRFYAHDPWFLNSPWLDRYGREPWDIYQPLSVARVDGQGKTRTADSISILTVDDTRGEMPDQVPEEVIPHLRQALRVRADAPGPLVWLYPFAEYHQAVLARHPEAIMAEELIIGEALQDGLPLNTVVGSDSFRQIINSGKGAVFAGRILVAPVSAFGDALEQFVNAGGDVIFYGALAKAPARLRELLGLGIAEELAGDFTVSGKSFLDEYASGRPADALKVEPQYAGGGLAEIPAGAEVFWTARQNGAERVLGSLRALPGKGRLAFIRAVFPSSGNVNACSPLSPLKTFPMATCFRRMLAEYGWKIFNRAPAVDSTLPRYTLHCHDNVPVVTAFARDTTLEARFATPWGAPILDEMETFINSGAAVWHLPRCWQKGCRCLARQAEDGVISSKIEFAFNPAYHGRIAYHGFKNAEVRFFPPAEYLDTFEAHATVNRDWYPYTGIFLQDPLPLEWEETPLGRCVVFRQVTGHMYFSW